MNEKPPSFPGPRAAIPVAPPTQALPQFPLAAPEPAPVQAAPAPAAKAPAKKAPAKPKAKVKAKAKTKKAAPKRKVGKHPALAAPYKKGDAYAALAQQPKNPNRPKELRNQLATVLGVLGQLSKSEGPLYTQLVSDLNKLSRKQRANVLGALVQTFGFQQG